MKKYSRKRKNVKRFKHKRSIKRYKRIQKGGKLKGKNPILEASGANKYLKDLGEDTGGDLGKKLGKYLGKKAGGQIVPWAFNKMANYLLNKIIIG